MHALVIADVAAILSLTFMLFAVIARRLRHPDLSDGCFVLQCLFYGIQTGALLVFFYTP